MRSLLRQLNCIEAPICRAANQKGDVIKIRRFFRVISRLGDGVFWYVLMALLSVLYGKAGIMVAAQMLLVGLLSLLVYKSIKHLTVRERPCDFHSDIHPHGPRLDHYSFPSGHTMHAVGFTFVLFGHFPEIALLVSPFVILVAWSRLVLGLHYPSDVVVGALIGASIAWISFGLPLF
jgi:undecaprenyl-diphosphatase